MGFSPFVWLIVAAVMALLEAVSLTFITVWFVVGGLAAFLASLVTESLFVQVTVFLVVSLACLALFRPLVLRHRALGAAHEATPVGQTAVVVEAIDPVAATGRVETPDRMSWAALSATGEPLAPGTPVRVVAFESVKLIVAPLPLPPTDPQAQGAAPAPTDQPR